jgi:hypothetical protein
LMDGQQIQKARSDPLDSSDSLSIGEREDLTFFLRDS